MESDLRPECTHLDGGVRICTFYASIENRLSAIQRLKMSLLKQRISEVLGSATVIGPGAVYPPASMSDSDISREEEKWSRKHETMLLGLMNDCKAEYFAHVKMSSILETMHSVLAMTCLFLQTASGITLLLSSSAMSNTLSVTMSGLSCIVTGVFSVANIGSLAQKHTRASGRYEALRQSIAYTLTRKRRYREACDIRMHKFMETFNGLSKNSPKLISIFMASPSPK